MGRSITQEEIQIMKTMRRNGYKVADIVKKTGFCTTTVWKYTNDVEVGGTNGHFSGKNEYFPVDLLVDWERTRKSVLKKLGGKCV